MKKSRVHSFLILGISIALLSCAKNKTEYLESVKNTLFDPVMIFVDVKYPFQWPNEKQVESITYFDSSPDFLITFFRKLIPDPKGRFYYVLDQSAGKILIFDKSGSGIAVLDKQGEGPEEYLQATDFQIDFEKEIIEIMDYLKIKKYDLNTLEYIGYEDLSDFPKDRNFRNFARIGQDLLLWTNLPPFQQVKPDKLGDHHLVKVSNGKFSYHIEKKFGVINGQVFYPSPKEGEYNIPPIVGSTDILAVNKDGVYTKYKVDYGRKNIPFQELIRFRENNEEIFNAEYYKPPQNIRETNNHLFFNFSADNGNGINVLFNKKSNTIQSIGKPIDMTGPLIIFSDKDYFYGIIHPEVINYYINNGGELRDTEFSKFLDPAKIESGNNPILIKFKIP